MACPEGYKDDWTGAVWGTGAHRCVPPTSQTSRELRAAIEANPIQIYLDAERGSKLVVRAPSLSEAQFKLATGPQEFRDLANKIVGQLPHEIFPGATLFASVLASAGLGAAGFPAIVSAAFQTAATQVERSQTGMALNLSQLLGGIGSAIGGVNNPYFQTGGQLLSAGSQIAAAFQGTPAVSYGPVYSPPPSVPMVQGGGDVYQVAAKLPIKQQTMTQEVFHAASKMLRAIGLAPSTVGAFMSATKRSLSALASLARRTPAGTLISLLVGLGLAANEANVLTAWWATTGKKRRRMNPANAKALRRAARRIKSFHRLCTHTDLIKTRRRSGGARCVTCKRSPCRC